MNKILSRFVKAGTLERVVRGIYMPPKESQYVGRMCASALTVMKLMTKANGETVQIHGAEAVRSMGLSTQMQMLPICHTTGSTRRIRIGNTTIRLQHASNDRRQYAKKQVWSSSHRSSLPKKRRYVV